MLNNMLEDRTTQRLETRLERQQYDEHQLITIKASITRLAYFNTSPTFERATGQIEVNGIPYRYVKRRIYNDSLEMLCIPNQAAVRLHESASNYFKLVNDIDQGAKPDPHAHKTFTSDPFTCIHPLQIEDLPYTITPLGYYFPAHLPFPSLPSIDHPPAHLVA